MKTVTENKQICPCCGQSVNKRRIALNKSMVISLKKIYLWCREKGVHEFKTSEINHLFGSTTESARFGDWVFFGGIFYKKEKGDWGLNTERAAAFLKGQLQITIAVWKDPLTKEVTVAEVGAIHKVKGIAAFVDPQGNYCVQYKK